MDYKNKNWVNDALDAAVNIVRNWPAWMKRPEVRWTKDYFNAKK